MARKDLRLMVEEAARGGQTLAMIPAPAKLLDEGIARGEGQLDVAAAVRVPAARLARCWRPEAKPRRCAATGEAR